MERRDYSEFMKTSLYDTGLLERTPKIEKSLEKKGIHTLADLFTQYDDKTYVPKEGSSQISRTMHGVINLARAKYLDIDLPTKFDIDAKHPYEYWFYTESDLNRSIFRDADIGTLRWSIDLPYVGVTWGRILKHATPCFTQNETQSLTDMMTSFEMREAITRISDPIEANRIQALTEYFTRHKAHIQEVELTEDMTVLLAEEKRLLTQLSALNEEQNRLTARLATVQNMKAEMIKRRGM